MFYVYILQCGDGSYYTGHTDNLEIRLHQHQNKLFPSCYTSTRLPVKLMYSESFNTREEAFIAEKQIQGWSRRKKSSLSSRLESFICLCFETALKRLLSTERSLHRVNEHRRILCNVAMKQKMQVMQERY